MKLFTYICVYTIKGKFTIIDRLKPLLNIKDKNSGPSFKERKEEKRKRQEKKIEIEIVKHK